MRRVLCKTKTNPIVLYGATLYAGMPNPLQRGINETIICFGKLFLHVLSGFPLAWKIRGQSGNFAGGQGKFYISSMLSVVAL